MLVQLLLALERPKPRLVIVVSPDARVLRGFLSVKQILLYLHLPGYSRNQLWYGIDEIRILHTSAK